MMVIVLISPALRRSRPSRVANSQQPQDAVGQMSGALANTVTTATRVQSRNAEVNVASTKKQKTGEDRKIDPLNASKARRGFEVS